MQETHFQSVDLEYDLKKEMTTHSSILAWKITWTEEPGGLHGVSKSQTQMNMYTHMDNNVIN